VIATIIPACISDYTVRILQLNPSTAERQLMLIALLNSYLFDYLARQRIGGTHLNNDILEQLPVPAFENVHQERSFVGPRALELTYTAWDLRAFAKDYGWSGPPFRWDEDRRFLLRCELDAAIFHLYVPAEGNGGWRQAEGEMDDDLGHLKAKFATPHDAVAYIMDTFPITRRKDEEKSGEYRTKRVILEIYDAMVESIRTGQPYQTRLDPPPVDPRCCHAPIEP
jgi:hypothetical protein